MEIYINGFIVIGLSLHFQTGKCIRNDIFRRNLSFDDKLPLRNVIGWAQSKSNTQCGRKCLESSSCQSYLYHSSTKNCTFLDDVNVDTSSVVVENGWRHYISQDALLTSLQTTVEQITTEISTVVTTVQTTTIETTVTTAQGLTCPGDYYILSDGSSCLKFHSKTFGQNYGNRQSICQGEGGNLAKIDSGGKQTKLHDYLENIVGVTDTELRIVIQGQEERPSGTWRFDDGSVITFTEWKSGQPNDGDDNCIAVRHTSYEWRDISCTMDAAFVCEIM